MSQLIHHSKQISHNINNIYKQKGGHNKPWCTRHQFPPHRPPKISNSSPCLDCHLLLVFLSRDECLWSMLESIRGKLSQIGTQSVSNNTHLLQVSSLACLWEMLCYNCTAQNAIFSLVHSSPTSVDNRFSGLFIWFSGSYLSFVVLTS